MRALLVNQYYPPDTSATAAMAQAFVDALAQAGHAVDVLAGRPSYDPVERRPWRLFRHERAGNANVTRVGSLAASRLSMRARIGNYLSYTALAVPAALAKNVDVVIAMTDPPLACHVGGAVARARRTPFVYWIQDFHPEFAVASGLLADGALVSAWRTAHRWALRTADLIVVLGDDMAERAVAAGAEAARIRVIPNGASRPDVGSGDRSHITAQHLRQGFPFVALHAGNLGFAGDWDALVEAARLLDPTAESIVFVGGGADRSRLVADVTLPPNLRFAERQLSVDVPHVYAAADLHIVSVRHGVEGLMVPSKIYDVLAAGRPVLAATPAASEVAAIVRRHECGYVVDPHDPAAIAKAIRHAHDHPAELSDMATRARQAAASYVRADMMERLVTLVEEVASGRGFGAYCGSQRAPDL